LFTNTLVNIILLHAGTPIAISEATLALMFVVLGIVLVGTSFGLFVKNKESLLQHRWSMSVAVALACGGIFAVMLPATFNFYMDPDVVLFSSMSITTIIHVVVSVPALVLGVIYAFGNLPKKVKSWMRYALVFWVASVALGVVMFIQMALM
jgi:hypothetical protein